MRLTRLGVKAAFFYCMLLAAFFAAPYLNLFFLLLAFLSVVAVLNLWWGFRNMQGVQGAILELSPVPAGAGNQGRVLVQPQQRKRLQLAIELVINRKRIAAGGPHDIEKNQSEASLDLHLPDLARGLHKVEAAYIHSNFPHGILRLQRKLACQETLVVYPQPKDLSEFRDRGELLQNLGGQEQTNAKDLGPSGLREYQSGDEMRQVHWKASARRAELVVKEYADEALPGWEIQLDLRCNADSLEASLSLLAALVLLAQENKECITLHSQDMLGTFGTGHRSWSELLHYLAAAQALPNDAMAPPAVGPTVLRLPAEAT